MIAVIDYGAGNLFSIGNALEKLGIEYIITSDFDVITKADGLILPGVGAFKKAMENLESTGLIPLIKQLVSEKKPLLGICLGMQLLYDESFEFGHTPGLKLIPGKIVALKNAVSSAHKVPHMGWNSLKIHQEDKIVNSINDGDFCYFVHSFYVESNGLEVLASAHYGVDVPAIVKKGPVFGMQFHPEKSGTVGLKLLKSFEEVVNDYISSN